MAFDGIMVAACTEELNRKITGGLINKIIQPEKDELMLNIRANRENIRLMISASAALPLIYITDESRQAPAQAPAFTMLLRKHLQGGKIISVTQPSLERIIRIEIEHLDELGDPKTLFLIVELMGKHSNIILADSGNTIIDSIKRIPSSISSVREVLPGHPYFIPKGDEKLNPFTVTGDEFICALRKQPFNLSKSLYMSLTGISPQAAEEFVFEAGLDGGAPTASFENDSLSALYSVFKGHITDFSSGVFSPCIISRNAIPVDFSAFIYKMYAGHEIKKYDSVSSAMVEFYTAKAAVTRMRQKSANLRHAASTSLSRAQRKLDLQKKQLRDTEKMENFRIYGEMLNTYGYEYVEGQKSVTVNNYYTNEPITIPMDETLTAYKNAQNYFKKYNKLKRTKESVSKLIDETTIEITELENILTSLDISENDADLSQIRREMILQGWIRGSSAERHDDKKGKKPSKKELSTPLKYRSREGFDMYVGKNNLQNDELSFKIAGNNDWWFHAKKMPGSHVILKTQGREVPDSVFEEASRLAAFYSKGRTAPKVEIDYTLRKNLKKPPASNPGFVIYHTNFSMMAVPDISDIERIE